MHNRKR